MKILELRFKNLNSLYGEWIIDFTDPAYAADPIFALIGPTGAGKSTILDGLCLALYGATPRLGKVTRSGNEIMSRQTGECYAEVLFESQSGRFRCRWEQRRARRHIGGKLQDQQHQISDEDTGKPIETKKSLVLKVIEEKTGMDFDRFTRSILLAQGGFDTFLKADDEQKSRILEQITGTEIYSAISRRVHERQRDEQQKLNLLKAEASGILLLDLEQEQEIRRTLADKQGQETKRTKEYLETQKSIAWLTGIVKLKAEIDGLQDEEISLNRRREDFEPERSRLDQALKAASIEGRYATLVAVRAQRAEDQTSLQGEQEALPDIEAALKSSTEALKSAEQAAAEHKKERAAAAPLLQRIRSLDQHLDEVTQSAAEIDQACEKEGVIIAALNEQRRAALKQRKGLEKALTNTERYLTDHAADHWLISGLAGIEAELASLQRREAAQKELEDKRLKSEQTLKQTVTELDLCTVRAAADRRKLQDIAGRLEKKRDALSELLGDRLLREHRREKEHLLREQAFLSRVRELEEHRSRLEDGRPCPLCGATEHPYAQGNVPPVDEADRQIELIGKTIDQAEDYQAAIKELEETRDHAEKELAAAENRLTAAAHEKNDAEKAAAAITENLGRIADEAAEIRNSLADKLEPLGMSGFFDRSGADLLKSLQQRLQRWQKRLDEKAVIERQLEEVGAECKRLEAVIETRTDALNAQQKRLASTREKIGKLAEERQKLFGDKRIEDEEKRLDTAVDQAESAEKSSRARHHDLARKHDAARHRIEALTKRLKQSAGALQKAEDDFRAALEPTGLVDEQRFLAARLSAGKRDALAARARELDASLTELAARKEDRRNRLRKETERRLTDESLEKLEQQSAEQETSLKQLREEIAGFRHRLDQDRSARERIKQKQAAIELQKKESQRWDKLHHLIGSADGKKYRTFAQGLTFELMVAHANRQLVEMSDRYLLIRDNLQPLELNVIDNYQAGEVRSTRNLSGGESFMVSLALALGLSRMASRNVRVDSLFLDEGFGSLDEDSLENALTTLSALRQENKLIGIISHVAALKDRIGTQISVIPLSGGRSTLSGPGCTKLQ